MPPITSTDVFERELQTLYDAELEILALHADLANAAASDEVRAQFSDHEADTVDPVKNHGELSGN